MSLAEEYLKKLKSAYEDRGSQKKLSDLNLAQGASDSEIEKLKAAYPDCPKVLIDLLRRINGTYHRSQGEHYINVYVLSSDIGHYPYYLLSVDQMLESLDRDEDFTYLQGSNPGEESLDPKMNPVLKAGKYIHFSDCMNNGGTSQLYIDLNPAEPGVMGQVLRFVHDPDECKVIANSFDEYLNMLMDNDFEFIH